MLVGSVARERARKSQLRVGGGGEPTGYRCSPLETVGTERLEKERRRDRGWVGGKPMKCHRKKLEGGRGKVGKGRE